MSIHEERIVAQRNHKMYKGYIPMNVEFLIEYLFAAGLSPQTHIRGPAGETLGTLSAGHDQYHIRQLYGLPEYDALY